jgi:hypothetical protein
MPRLVEELQAAQKKFVASKQIPSPLDDVLASIKKDCLQAAEQGHSSTRVVYLNFVGNVAHVEDFLESEGLVTEDFEVWKGDLMGTVKW